MLEKDMSTDEEEMNAPGVDYGNGLGTKVSSLDNDSTILAG